MTNFHFTDYVELIEFHQKIKNNVTIQDAYKLIYQSIFGNSHLLQHVDQARIYLIEEFESIQASSEEPLIEPISPQGNVVRINLRPFKRQKKNIDGLFQAMIASARQIAGSVSEIQRVWDEFKQAVAANRLHFDDHGLIGFDHEIQAQHFPAVHHSAAYRMANHPAYRVVHAEVFDNYCNWSATNFRKLT